MLFLTEGNNAMKRVFITTGIIAVIGGAGTAVLSSSCDTVCTLEAAPSVIVQITAGEGTTAKAITADGVWYEITDAAGGTETVRGECLDDECTEWILGYEQEGTYAIHADVCGQEYEGSATVELTDDGCHVNTQWVQIPVDASTCAVEPADVPVGQAEPTTCTLESRPSVIVDVAARKGDRLWPMPADRVFFQWSGDKGNREFPGTCLNEDCSQFAAGREQAGEFTVGAEVCGNVFTESVEIGKTEDGCHVDTDRVVIVADLNGCEGGPPTFEVNVQKQCSLEARPSAMIFPVTDGGDVWMPHPTEQLWFEHDDKREKAFCAEPAANGKCLFWVVGWEQAGRFKAYTESCGTEKSLVYSVGKTDDGCHVATEYLPVFMDTTGCINGKAPPPPGVPPATGGPH